MSSNEKISIAACVTHHIDKNGNPIYENRFEEVLAFHEVDGNKLASVSIHGNGWHIRTNGHPAYTERFLRTFGYYCGCAAVISPKGWFHIRPDGSELYSERYTFAGNFQNDLAVVCDDIGTYFHIDVQGKPIYESRWAYCGDFRENIAVVQEANGLSTHIYQDGKLVHDRWFCDLDVFHKGYARAKDLAGWHHINKYGNPIYDERYVSVEPFYNGYARCETQTGSLVIISENGQVSKQLRTSTIDWFSELSADMVGYWKTLTISTAVKLGIFDNVPAPASDLAAQIGCSVSDISRLLNALSELGLIRVSDSVWIATQKGAYLNKNHPKTLATAAIEYSGDLLDRWQKLPEILQKRSPDAGIFRTVANDTTRVLTHHQMLRSYALHDYSNLTDFLVLYPEEIVFDVGGGTGALATILQSAYPHSKIFLGDLPEVVATTNFPRKIGFDFFNPWPILVDKIILSRILHDWPDNEAIAILRNARNAMKQSGEMYIIEMLLDEKSPSGSLCDLHLLAVTGGQERTLTQFQNLVTRAGLVFDRKFSSTGLVSVLCIKKNEK